MVHTVDTLRPQFYGTIIHCVWKARYVCIHSSLTLVTLKPEKRRKAKPFRFYMDEASSTIH